MESGELEPTDGPEEPATRGRRLRRLALQVDTHPALLTAAERPRRRLPGDERFGDPLSTAGPEAVEVLARGVSALQPKRKSLVQELGFAGRQVWQSLSRRPAAGTASCRRRSCSRTWPRSCSRTWPVSRAGR